MEKKKNWPTDDDKPRISIVVVTYLSKDYTKLCLDAVRKNTTAPHEVVFVDNNSDDGTLEYLQSLEAKVISSDRRLTRGQLFNRGARETSGDLILFLDDDTVPQDGWLEGMLAPISLNCDIGISGARLVSPGLEDPLHCGYSIDEFDQPNAIFRRVPLELSPQPQKTIAVSSSCMLVERSVFEQLGGFSEDFRDEYEDVDFCLRARQAGYITAFCPSSKVWHYEIETTSRLPFREFNLSLLQEKWDLSALRRECLSNLGANLVLRDYIERLERKIDGLETWLAQKDNQLAEQQAALASQQGNLHMGLSKPFVSLRRAGGKVKRRLKRIFN